ncbi:type II secretion system minor pseudopilin GspI [Yersinia enterocolitica]|uniref:type II secretion system minor pseudopilin GspI n=1 Tax=Yersinia enterocolitica TaxID=630 RepID=UPI001C8EBD34|nr:type II secretion system minor pseudopilin GspI [Yersinia enterocolitica]EKN4180478.1 type II secretion system minor pseudopilin GspI [Yersinia enterocolitica]MBX9487361.1 type II secretion system minor pseudopilin GspI [Yersinia enterocolitica]MBX9490727.1 type II secretion system minor pseudopilin GspI [Yersinia enterocolitica]HEN3447305.1 type II secretion system minor pseudopilin GspI [Yersinia enterocolitica]HEN3638971.1 type II secretion system minor pseudopilin GspI [Yersinia enteroc
MNCRGMTLLEVMIALLILSMAGLAVIKSTGEQVRNLSYLEQKQLAAWVAENQLVNLRLEKVWPTALWHSGTSEMGNNHWHWRWRGVPTTDDKLRAIEIEVRLDPESSQHLAQLRTYVTRQ